MSVVTIVTELTEQEISGIVGGATKAYTSGKSSSEGKNSQSNNQSATNVANGGGKYSETKASSYQGNNQSIDNSRDVAVVKYYY
ncbi:MAG: hypothetical protein KME46_26145 [Brasilonema angustatum HA4187-MV1]|jgi:hypothetical protein|nr:hypothetical protein [Brasilonema angustatum HA4187-MV1]